MHQETKRELFHEERETFEQVFLGHGCPGQMCPLL